MSLEDIPSDVIEVLLERLDRGDLQNIRLVSRSCARSFGYAIGALHLKPGFADDLPLPFLQRLIGRASRVHLTGGAHSGFRMLCHCASSLAELTLRFCVLNSLVLENLCRTFPRLGHLTLDSCFGVDSSTLSNLTKLTSLRSFELRIITALSSFAVDTVDPSGALKTAFLISLLPPSLERLAVKASNMPSLAFGAEHIDALSERLPILNHLAWTPSLADPAQLLAALPCLTSLSVHYENRTHLDLDAVQPYAARLVELEATSGMPVRVSGEREFVAAASSVRVLRIGTARAARGEVSIDMQSIMFAVPRLRAVSFPFPPQLTESFMNLTSVDVVSLSYPCSEQVLIGALQPLRGVLQKVAVLFKRLPLVAVLNAIRGFRRLRTLRLLSTSRAVDDDPLRPDVALTDCSALSRLDLAYAWKGLLEFLAQRRPSIGCVRLADVGERQVDVAATAWAFEWNVRELELTLSLSSPRQLPTGLQSLFMSCPRLVVLRLCFVCSSAVSVGEAMTMLRGIARAVKGSSRALSLLVLWCSQQRCSIVGRRLLEHDELELTEAFPAEPSSADSSSPDAGSVQSIPSKSARSSGCIVA